MSLEVLRPEGTVRKSIILQPGEKKHLVVDSVSANGDMYLDCKLSKDTSLTIEYIAVSGRNAANFQFELEEQASLTFDGAFALAGKDRLDFNYKTTHLGTESKSCFNLVGTLDGEAQKNSTETIDFRAGATNAEGSESEKITLFSDSAKNTAQPIILCDEENMHGEHSFSSGHLDPEVVNYLRARGVDFATAKKIISREQILRVVKLCKNKDIIEKIHEALQ